MNKEELLKNISGLLKKNETFFNSNPEFFYAVQDRLLKAIDYEDYQAEPQDEEDESSNYGEDMFDKPQSDEDSEDEDYQYVNPADEDGDGEVEDDEAAKWLAEHGEEAPENDEENYIKDDEQQTHADEDIPVQKKPEEKKTSNSGYGSWKPKDEYKPEHDAKIKEHLKNGYSHREAERLAGAHDAPPDFYSALKSKVKPSQPSPKMLEHLKGLVAPWLQNYEKVIGENAEATKNPQKHAAAKVLAAHEATHGDFTKEYDKFLGSDEIKGLKGRERMQAINSWKQKFHEANPDYKEKSIAAADTGKVYNEANQARKQHLEESKQAILGAGKSSGDDEGMSGEYSQAASGDISGMRGQAAAQLVGGEQGESGYSSNVVKDPAMAFAEKHPEYVKSLQTKLQSGLKPEQAQRLSAVKSITRKGVK